MITCFECEEREGCIETTGAEFICEQCFEDEGYEECRECELASKECHQDHDSGRYVCPDCEDEVTP